MGSTTADGRSEVRKTRTPALGSRVRKDRRRAAGSPSSGRSPSRGPRRRTHRSPPVLHTRRKSSRAQPNPPRARSAKRPIADAASWLEVGEAELNVRLLPGGAKLAVDLIGGSRLALCPERV